MKTKRNLFNALTADENRLLLAAILLPPPVTLDHLVGIEPKSPVYVLRTMESLVQKGLLCLADEGYGYYRLKANWVLDNITNLFHKSQILELAEDLIGVIRNSDLNKTNKSLIVANIIDISKNAGVIDIDELSAAANYCLEIGAMEAATHYFQLILQAVSGTRENLRFFPSFIDAVLGIISSNGHLMPLRQQAELLQKAAVCARKIADQEKLCLINLRLAQVVKTEGDYKTAEALYEEAWDIAKQLNREDLLRQAALFTSDFLFWQGLVADAVSRYEEAIGDTEKLPADQATLRATATLGWCYGICGMTARGIGLIEAVKNRADALRLIQVKAYAEVMAVLTLIDAHRAAEAEIVLDNIFQLSEETLGNYILWASYAARAYILCMKGELERCFHFQKKAFERSKAMGWPHHRGPYNFDYMDILEDAGFVHPEMNYESEIKRVCDWPDVYMRGVGLRYRAQRAFKNKQPIQKIMPDIEQSINLLTRAGALIELSHAQLLMARIKLQEQSDNSMAKSLLRSAWDVLSSVNPDFFPEELRPFLEYESAEDETIATLVEVGNAIGTVRERDRLLTRIINLLMRLTCAGRGGVFLFDGDKRPKLIASRNLDDALVESPRFVKGWEIISSVLKSDNEIVQSDLSGLAAGWQLCSPVKLGTQLFGAIYLDNTLIGLQPPHKIISVLKLVCNQMAVALDNANAYDEIERLKDRLENETNFYRMELECQPEISRIVGQSNEIKLVLAKIEKVSKTDSTVLILGETGVGKELVARAIHRQSERRGGAFIPVNTASLNSEMIASELFGHEKGAFTGAIQQRQGRFELANGGTLFLDDIDAISIDVQAKILRAIQEKEFERVGGNRTLKSDFRLIAATNADLQALIKKGGFRSDLFYRLNVFPIIIPPLRDRKEDIPILATHFLKIFTTKMNRRINGFTKENIKTLTRYSWPGNVRELKHIIERAVILSDGGTVVIPELAETSGPRTFEEKFLTYREMERAHILKALSKCGGKISGEGGAWKLLDLKASTLYAKMRKLGIERRISSSVSG